MIPATFIQDLLARVDIVDVVGRHVELKRGGANFMGLCPFHGEKSPSFSVSPSKQFYYCFGCGASGDAIRFLTEHLGLSFIEAVRDLAQGAGLTVPEEQVSDDERQRRETLRNRRQSLSDVMERAATFYREALPRHRHAVDYLKQRGLSGAVAKHFGIGFAPPGWRTLAGVFPHYDDPLLEEAGLVRQREIEEPASLRPDTDAADPHGPSDPGDLAARPKPTEGADRGRYDWFRDRVMFPIRSVDGRLIGFGGRVLGDGKPKYINSPETPVFSKGRELYGLYEARQALRDKGCALVVEGYMDVVALAQSGFANAVATLGTACTADHVQKLFRFTDSVVFAFDGDPAGRRAAGRALEAALPHATDLRSVRFLFLPPEHDPDSFVRTQGQAAFEAAIQAAVPLSRQLVEQAGADIDRSTAEGRSRLLAQARPLWQALPEGALRRQLLASLAREAQLEVADLVALWREAGASESPHTGNGFDGGRASGRTGGSGPGIHLKSGRASIVMPAVPLRRAGRRAPAAPADLALRLLLRHSDWWQRLNVDDQHLLHGLDGDHGLAVAWLERQLDEHGAMTWAALDPALAAQPWADDARRWVDTAAPDEEQRFEDLRCVLHRLWRQHLGNAVNRLIAQGAEDRLQLDAITALNQRIQFHREAERDLTAPP